MKTVTWARIWLPLAMIAMSGCASLPQNALQMPEVRLSNIQPVGLGFDRQTFLLSFDVSNPNPLSLPVRHIAYGLKLNGQHFASGETDCEFSIPANGATTFAINVDLNLLETAPQLLLIVRDSARQDIAYIVEGQLGVDIPFVPAVRYRNSGHLGRTADRQ